MAAVGETKQVAPKKIYPTVIAALLFGLLGGSDGLFFLRILAALCVFVWSIFVCVSAWMHPQTRKTQAIRVGVWALAIATTFVIQDIRERSVREQANDILAKVQTYTAATGHCPVRLEDIGLSTTKTWTAQGIFYNCDENTPHIGYMSPATKFDRWYYDFEENVWVFHPD